MPREVQVNALMAVTLGALEGGLLGVIVKTGFDQVAAPALVNLAVAMVAGAPAFANAASLAFANLAHGRHKTRWVSALMATCSGCAILIALSPVSAAGLVWLVFWMIAARLCWTGVITLRAAIWRANFPRHVRATITGRIAVTYSLLIALTAAATGIAMEFHAQAWRATLPTSAFLGLAAAWRYRRFTVRGHGRLLREESTVRCHRRLEDRSLVPTLYGHDVRIRFRQPDGYCLAGGHSHRTTRRIETGPGTGHHDGPAAGPGGLHAGLGAFSGPGTYPGLPCPALVDVRRDHGTVRTRRDLRPTLVVRTGRAGARCGLRRRPAGLEPRPQRFRQRRAVHALHEHPRHADRHSRPDCTIDRSRPVPVAGKHATRPGPLRAAVSVHADPGRCNHFRGPCPAAAAGSRGNVCITLGPESSKNRVFHGPAKTLCSVALPCAAEKPGQSPGQKEPKWSH